MNHQPRKYIFDPKKEIPKHTSARLQRWAIDLMGFDFEIKHSKGKSIPQVDSMSRLKFSDSSNEEGFEETSHFVHWENNDISLTTIKEETERDQFLKRIMNRVTTNKWYNCSVKEKPYKTVRQVLTIEEGILFKGTVPVIPECLRKSVVKSAHSTHCGIVATKRLIQLEAWWPGFSLDVERWIRECSYCSENKQKNPVHLDTWQKEDKAWIGVHMDHAITPLYHHHIIPNLMGVQDEW